MSTGRLWHVDAFAPAPFTGNPAAVLVLDAEPDDGFCLRSGAELNQPATAVAWPAGPPGWFGLRWFTAIGELELCGHGTLAAARVLLDSGAGVDGRVCFETMSGPLEARAAGEWVQLALPRLAPQPLIGAADAAPGAAGDGEAVLGEAVLGEAVRRLLDVPVTLIMRNDLDVLAVLPSPGHVREAHPDLAALERLPVRGLIITASGDIPGPGGAAGGAADFVSRFFSPAHGIGEDAVTGSAHCALGPYWIRALGRQPLLGRQLSARGGLVQVAEDGDRVLLAGPALVLSEGSWRQPATAPGQPVAAG